MAAPDKCITDWTREELEEEYYAVLSELVDLKKEFASDLQKAKDEIVYWRKRLLASENWPADPDVIIKMRHWEERALAAETLLRKRGIINA